MENDDVPKVSTRALLVHLLGENQRMHEVLSQVLLFVTPEPPPKWYVRAFFWILDWRSTIIAGIAMIPWRRSP